MQTNFINLLFAETGNSILQTLHFLDKCYLKFILQNYKLNFISCLVCFVWIWLQGQFFKVDFELLNRILGKIACRLLEGRASELVAQYSY